MNPNDKDKNRLQHMLDAALEAQLFMKDKTRETLPQNRMAIQATVRSIEIIGEAAANISKEFQNAHSEIPWGKIVGMRNRLVHAYFDIDYDRIWDTVQKELPILISQIKKLLQNK